MNRYTDLAAGIFGIVLLLILERFVARAIRRSKQSMRHIFRSISRPVFNAKDRKAEVKRIQSARKSQGLPPFENPHI